MKCLLDMFRVTKLEKLSVKGMDKSLPDMLGDHFIGLDNVLAWTLQNGKIHLCGYSVSFERSGTKVNNSFYSARRL